jgi:hypothetical protein
MKQRSASINMDDPIVGEQVSRVPPLRDENPRRSSGPLQNMVKSEVR